MKWDNQTIGQNKRYYSIGYYIGFFATILLSFLLIYMITREVLPWWSALALIPFLLVILKPVSLAYLEPWALVAWFPLFTIADSNFAPHDLIMAAMYILVFIKMWSHPRGEKIKVALLLLVLSWAIYIPGLIGTIIWSAQDYILRGFAVHLKRFAIPAIYPLFLCLFFEKNKLTSLLTNWWLMALVVSLITIKQFFSDPFIERPVGIVYNPNDAGAWAVFLVMLSIWGILSNKKWMGIGLLLGMMGFLVSASRSWTLGLIFGLGAWAFVLGIRKAFRWILGIATVITISYSMGFLEPIFKRWTEIVQHTADTSPITARFLIYKLSIIMIAKSPLFGYGPEITFLISPPIYKSMEGIANISPYVYYQMGMGAIDNLWLQHIADFGIIGTIMLISIIWIFVKRMIRLRDRKNKGLVLSIMLAFVPVSLFISVLLSYWISPFFWFLVGLVLTETEVLNG